MSDKLVFVNKLNYKTMWGCCTKKLVQQPHVYRKTTHFCISELVCSGLFSTLF